MASPKPELDTSKAILTVDEAAALLGVSVKTFNKVLHQERVPARKVGREWKFSRQALIDWVGSGDSSSFYKPDRSGSATSADLDGGSWRMKNS